MKAPIVTLLTDFGPRDPYAAAMKGVILSINPRCQLIDLSHEVSPHDVEEGAYVLLNAFSWFPAGTIHVGVVDPGVGGPRKPILVVTKRYFFVGPDNGLFAFVLEREKPNRVIHLTNPQYFLRPVSPTFHGRDLFAPVAGHLSRGKDPNTFGEPLEQWETLGVKEPIVKGERLIGEIFYVDRFGNLVSNISEAQLHDFLKGRPLSLRVGGQRIDALRRGYWEAEKGEILALIGSGGLLEIAVREGRAAAQLGIKKGAKVVVTWGSK